MHEDFYHSKGKVRCGEDIGYRISKVILSGKHLLHKHGNPSTDPSFHINSRV